MGYCFSLGFINKNQSSQWELPNNEGRVQLPFDLRIKTMELKKDLVLETPLSTLSSQHYRSPRSFLKAA